MDQHALENDTYRIILKKVSLVCIVCNLMLCLVKATGGLIAHSSALVSDAINSGFDVISGIIVLIGAKVSQQQADKEHPYGHERLENVATIILAVILFVTGIFVGHTVIEQLSDGSYKNATFPGILSIIAALISIVTKEILFWYTRGKAEQIQSVSLKAAAWDHRTDVIATLGALIGIIAARCGFPAGDLIASLVVCLFIIRTAYLVFREAISQMTDRSCDESVLEQLRDTALSVEGVLGIDLLQVRTFGNRLYVDLELQEDGNKPLKETHKVAEQVHDLIEQQFPIVKHIMIHVNPADETASANEERKSE